MKSQKELQDMLSKLKSDERNYYPTANVFSNAPLALIQLGLSTRINTLEEVLDLPISKFPLNNKTKKADGK